MDWQDQANPVLQVPRPKTCHLGKTGPRGTFTLPQTRTSSFVSSAEL
jgi:hypothetical protein